MAPYLSKDVLAAETDEIRLFSLDPIHLGEDALVGQLRTSHVCDVATNPFDDLIHLGCRK